MSFCQLLFELMYELQDKKEVSEELWTEVPNEEYKKEVISKLETMKLKVTFYFAAK